MSQSYRVLQESFSAVDVDLRKAVMLHQRGLLIEAERIYRDILELVPTQFDALHMLGILKHQQEKNTEAIQLIRLALRQSPNDVLVLTNYGAVLNMSSRFQEGLSILDRALALNPNHAEALYNRGIALQGLRLYEEALESYERAIALKPNNAEAFNNRGNALKELKRPAEALASYDSAIALKPNSVEALLNRGVVLQELKRFRDALASYDRAIALKPDNADALINRGNVLKELKRCDDALLSYERAIALRPHFAEAFNNRGIVLKELKLFDEALTNYDSAIALQPNYAEAFNNRGNAHMELGHLEEALASFEQAIALKPHLAEAFNNRGNALKALNRYNEALASYQQAIVLNPNSAEAFNNLSVELKELGRLTEARRAAQLAVQLAPQQIRYYQNLGELAPYARGDPRVAAMEQLAHDASSLSIEEQIELHFALGKAYQDLGRYADAFERWTEGNHLKRGQITYDEATTLGVLDRIPVTFTSELIRKWHNVGNPSSVPVFIVGMPRSGTTLVEQILASHPEVFGGGELRHFRSAVETVRKEFSDSTNFPDFVPGMSREDLRTLGSCYLTEIERLAPGAARITDKMIGNYVFVGLIHLALPNATVIHCIRDPVDTCISCFSKLFGPELRYTYDLAELGRYYRHYQEVMTHWRETLPPDRILEVHYEDVVADLEDQARRIITHCELAWDPRCLSFHQTERLVLTPSATQVRQPIYNNAVGRRAIYKSWLQPLIAELDIA